jgi:hypothetical protein
LKTAPSRWNFGGASGTRTPDLRIMIPRTEEQG